MLYNVLNAGFEYTNLAAASAAPETGALWFVLNGELYKRLPGGAAIKAGYYTVDYVLVHDQKASANGGDFNSGAWRTRDLNTEVADTAGVAALAANQLTLAAGTYYITARCPARRVNAHQCRLYDITNGIVLLTGTPGYSEAADASPGDSDSWLQGQIVLSGATVLELQHQCTTTRAGDGFGINYSGGAAVDIYSQLEAWMITL